MTVITYDKYQKVVGTPDWCVHVLEDGKSRLVFFGATEDEAMGKAQKWANAALDTPERQEMLRQRALDMVAKKAKKRLKGNE